MTQVVIYTTPEGRRAVITPAPGVTAEQAASAVPAGLSWQVVNVADLEPEAPEPMPFPLLDGFQFRAMLDGFGLLEAAEQIAEQAGGLVLLAWRHAKDYNRHSPFMLQTIPVLAQINPALNDPAVIDAAWRQASTVRI
jgi:hypothetical protein